MDPVAAAILVVATVAIAWVVAVVFSKKARPVVVETDQDTSDTNGDVNKGKKQAAVGKKGGSKPGKSKTSQQQPAKEKFTHQWLISTMKGHTGLIRGMDLSPNNKFLLTCADDRTVYLWFTKDFSDRDHKSIRVNIPFDCANYVRWSPDSKAFIIAREGEKMLEVYKLGRKPDNSIGNITPSLQWPQNAEKSQDYVGLGVACNGKYVMSCIADGTVELRDKGTILKKFLSPLPKTVGARVSPCGRYIAVFGQQDVVIFLVKFNATSGQVEDVDVKWKVKVKGSSDITSIDFNTDSSKLVMLCQSGSWHLYDTTGSRVNEETKGQIEDAVSTKSNATVALSGDARVVLIGAQNNLYFFSAFSGQLLDQIADVHKGIKQFNS
ncbi:unnamed protein product [Orchesella dallaii]|uniref:Transducin beta-like protein 2 n=1 Tax=Orchesella dallaii TaxID=48710 RepID=A0ABP1RKZ9_9HEXA